MRLGTVRRARSVAAAGAVVVLALMAVPGHAAAPAAPALHDAFGLHVTKVQQVDARQVSIDVQTAALGRPANIRVALPADYAQHPKKRYPVLYLITGTGGHSPDWFTDGNAEQITAGQPLIVVSTDVGIATAGWFANWQDTATSLGPNQWETYYIDQVIPFVDASFRTRANRDGRAIAGLSQGGFGSTFYPTRHPDLFVSFASFSGAVDIAQGDPAGPLGHAFVIGTETASGIGPFAIFGDPTTDEISWQGHDPTTLLPNTTDMDVWLYTGNGVPGPLDTGADPAGTSIEVLAHTMTHAMYDHAQELGLANVNLVDYGAGTHTWPYWQRDLTQYLPHIMDDFARQPAAPSPTTYTSIEKSWRQWGWSISFARTAAQEWSNLTGAGPLGFSLTGSGTATVITPAFYKPKAALKVTLHSSSGVRTVVLHAGKRGHLTLTVPLTGSSDGGSGDVQVNIVKVPTPKKKAHR